MRDDVKTNSILISHLFFAITKLKYICIHAKPNNDGLVKTKNLTQNPQNPKRLQ